MIYSIAIDGPAGAGKSTIARALATDLGFTYVETGAMYRAIALWTIQAGIDPEDEKQIEEKLTDADICVKYRDGVQQMYLNGINVTEELRNEKTGSVASVTSKYNAVRNKLVEMQREIASEKSVIMDGRDIGTQVLPNAFLKIFMVADPKIRAQRRYDELSEKGIECNFDTILEDIKKRDYADENRKISPLKAADDAVIVDTSEMTIEEVVERIRELFKEKESA